MSSLSLAAAISIRNDDLAAPTVAIVNEQFGRKIFQGKNPIGGAFRREEFGDTPDSQFLVIGLVRNTKYYETP